MNNNCWMRWIVGILFLVGAMLISCSPVASNNPTGESSKINSGMVTSTPGDHPTQRLRISNQSTQDLQNLVVIFPEERVEFGDVPAGKTTGYFEFQKGVYRYAAYNVTIASKRYEQPVVDWVGESPVDGEAFTYSVNVDPTKWETENWVIRLLDMTRDQ